MISYFDSSVLLSIILDQERQEQALSLWQNATEKTSSILLRIETLVSLRRNYANNKNNLGTNWLSEKNSILNGYLDEVDCLNVSNKVEKVIIKNNDLCKCRSLDAIHIATALIIKSNIIGDNINFYTFDTNMHEIAMNFGFITNEL
jgi:predicted nucleic acid-binding protein